MFCATLLDLLAVSLIAPFVSVLMGQPVSLRFLEQAFASIGLGHWGGFRILGTLIMAVYLVKGFLAYMLNRRIVYFAERRRAELMVELLQAFQSRPYEYHLHHPSNVLINKVMGLTASYAGGTLRASLSILSDLIVLIALATYLALSNWMALVILLGILGTVFWIVGPRLRRKLAESYQVFHRLSANILGDISHSLAGLREIRILGREAYFRDRVHHSAFQFAEQTSFQSALQLIPRSAIEAAVVWFLVLFSFVVLGIQRDSAQVLPLLGTFAVAGVRLMPVATGLLNNISTLRASSALLHELAEDLRAIRRDPPATGLPAADPDTPAPAFRELRLEGVHFRYRDASTDTLHNIDLHLQAGQMVGIIGRSGAGKSTLADLLIGLLQPSAGTVRVNGRDIREDVRSWQRTLAYIPQSIYLLDDSLRRNIALGVADHEVDEIRLAEVIHQSQLDRLVAGLPQGVATLVGERGVRLSGGQRQRVAIARALYFRREVLILDEATSALDSTTEREVVEAINAMHGQVTLIVIAHRVSTLQLCDHMIRVEQGQIVDSGPPAEVLARREADPEAFS